jgi:preprotein translocase subunit SecD
VNRPHLTGRGVVALAFLAILLAISLSACNSSGGKEDGDGGRALLTLDVELGDPPEGFDKGAFLQAIAAILTSRAETFGADGVSIEADTENARLTVTAEGGISADQAREIFLAPGQLDLRQPYRNVDGDIVCRPESGDDFAVPPDSITYPTDDPSTRPLPKCAGPDGQTGDVVWASPAAPRQEATAGLPITPTRASVDRTQSPAVFIELNTDGLVTLQQLTDALVGLPLGIFVDGELMAGPTVKESLRSGLLVIGGLSLPEADTLAAKIGAGPLPTTLKEVEPEPDQTD